MTLFDLRRTRPARRSVLAATAAALGLLAGAVALHPADAAAPPHVLTAAGADVTDGVMGNVLARYANDPANTAGEATANIPSIPGANGFTVPADSTCEARTYVVAGSPPATYTAPASAGQGKTALVDPTNLANGCIDIARSSSGPAAGESTALRYFGFGRDVVTWGALAGGHAPSTLTKPQIKGIYDCTFTNWNQVGGTSGRIQRYFTQPGSGAGSVFQKTILDNVDPLTISSPSCPPVISAQQSRGSLVATADRAFAIMPYSSSDWVAQANGRLPNYRAGFTARPITVSGNVINPIGKPVLGKYVPNDAAITGGAFPSVRTVYNVVDADSVAYDAAVRAIGFNTANPATGFRSPLCSGTLGSVLRSYGLLPFQPDANGLTCTFTTP